MNSALTRFRVMAYATGVMLLVLVVVAMPLKYVWHSETFISIVGPFHGVLYMVYLVTAFDLAVRNKWSFGRTLLLLFAGVVPALSFIVERKATGWLRTAEGSAPLARTGAGSATG
jgi:integral membrane protein